MSKTMVKICGAGRSLRFNTDKGGFGLLEVIAALVIISVMTAAAMPSLEGYFKLGEAKSAINAANGIINAEIQYQQASYSNYAERGNATGGSGGYFGTLLEMIYGMNILPAGNRQSFLPEGISLSMANYGGNGNCLEKQIGGDAAYECLADDGNGQFELVIYGLNRPGLSEYVPMFESGIKGGLSGYSNGALTVEVNVPFGFSAYPVINNRSGAVNVGSKGAAGGGGNGGTGGGGGSSGQAIEQAIVNNTTIELQNAAAALAYARNTGESAAQVQEAQNAYNTLNGDYQSEESSYGLAPTVSGVVPGE